MELYIITPQGTKGIREIEKVTLPGTAGSFTLLKGHAPLVSVLSNGQLHYQTGQEAGTFSVYNGVVKVENNIIQVITDSNT